MIFHQEQTHPLSHNRIFSTGGRWRESPSPAENLLITPHPPEKIPSPQQTPPYQIFILIFIFLFLFYFLSPPALNNNFQVTTQ